MERISGAKNRQKSSKKKTQCHIESGKICAIHWQSHTCVLTSCLGSNNDRRFVQRFPRKRRKREHDRFRLYTPGDFNCSDEIKGRRSVTLSTTFVDECYKIWRINDGIRFTFPSARTSWGPRADDNSSTERGRRLIFNGRWTRDDRNEIDQRENTQDATRREARQVNSIRFGAVILKISYYDQPERTK